MTSFSLSTDFSLITHLSNIDSWPWLGTSSCTLSIWVLSFGLVQCLFGRGGKQWTLEREFLVLMHQATATSKSQLVSSKTLSKISASIRSIFSNKPLLHGTAAVVSMIIPKLSHVC